MTTPAVPGAPPAPAPPAPPAPPPPAPAPPSPAPGAPPAPPAPAAEEQEPSSPPKWLNMRLEQHKRSVLKALGFESEEQAKTRMADVKRIEDEAEDRRKAQLSEVEREKERATKAERERDEARAAADATNRRVAILSAAQQHAVKNVPYAEYLLRDAPKDGDFTALLAAHLANPSARAALMTDPVPTTTVLAPSTSPTPGAPPAPPAPAPVVKDDMALTGAELEARRKEINAMYGLR